MFAYGLRYGHDAGRRAIPGQRQVAAREREGYAPRRDQRRAAVRSREPGRRKRVRFVGVDDVEALLAQEASQEPRRSPAPLFRRCGVNRDARALGALGQRRAAGRNQFRRMAALLKSAEQQQRLTLAATPGALEVHEQ